MSLVSAYMMVRLPKYIQYDVKAVSLDAEQMLYVFLIIYPIPLQEIISPVE